MHFSSYFFGIQFSLVAAAESDDERLKRSITGGFREGCEEWFLSINFFKWLAVIASLYLAYSPVGQAAMMIAIVCTMTGATLLVLPYESHQDNQLEVALHAIELLILIIGLVHHGGGMGEDAANGLLFTLVACSFILSGAAICLDLSLRCPKGEGVRKGRAELEMEDAYRGRGIIRPSENPMRV